MNIEDFVKDNEAVQAWAKGWIDDCKTGRHIGVRKINEVALKIMEQYCIDGAWDPEAEEIFNTLRAAAKIAQGEYENEAKNIGKNF